MRVLCRYGHYSFYPNDSKEVGRFISVFDKELVRVQGKDFYTFPALAELEDYSLEGKLYGGLLATKTYEGEPWEIMRENNWVHSIENEKLVPKLSVLTIFRAQLVTYFFIANTPLVQAGSINAAGKRIISFDGELDLDAAYTFRIREFQYE